MGANQSEPANPPPGSASQLTVGGEHASDSRVERLQPPPHTASTQGTPNGVPHVESTPDMHAAIDSSEDDVKSYADPHSSSPTFRRAAAFLQQRAKQGLLEGVVDFDSPVYVPIRPARMRSESALMLPSAAQWQSDLQQLAAVAAKSARDPRAARVASGTSAIQPEAEATEIVPTSTEAATTHVSVFTTLIKERAFLDSEILTMLRNLRASILQTPRAWDHHASEPHPDSTPGPSYIGAETRSRDRGPTQI